MTGNHLSEIDIQQYAFDKINCPKHIADHVETCEACALRVANYQLIFSEIKQYPKPVLDFDLEKMVLAKLSKPASSFSGAIFWAYALSILLISGIAVFGYLYQDYLVKIFTGILPIVIYL